MEFMSKNKKCKLFSTKQENGKLRQYTYAENKKQSNIEKHRNAITK